MPSLAWRGPAGALAPIVGHAGGVQITASHGPGPEPAPPAGAVFASGFETGNTFEWGTVTDQRGLVSVTSAAAKFGGFGLHVDRTVDVAEASVTKTGLSLTSASHTVQFYLFMSDDFHVAAPGLSCYAWGLRNSGNSFRLSLQIVDTAAEPQLRILDGIQFGTSAATTITRGDWHKIEVVFSGMGTATGAVTLKIDGTSAANLTARNWATPAIDRMTLGYVRNQAISEPLAGFIQYDTTWLALN